MTAERKKVLDAALVLLAEWKEGYYTDSAIMVKHEAFLVKELEKAQKELDRYRRSRGFWMALDALLPGWVAMDDYDFVSNDTKEWTEYLLSKGVDRDTADELVIEAFKMDG